jgi:hypothetical protein
MVGFGSHQVVRHAVAALSFVILVAPVRWAAATERDFTLVTSQSHIALSGTVTSTSFGTAPIQPQGTGSLTTNYSGTIKTDRAAGGITFIEGSAVDANVNGNWRPLADASDGKSPADYGAKVSYLGGFVVINFAGRNLVAGLVGPATPVDASGMFDLSATSVVFATGDLAYRGPLGNPVGTGTLGGESGLLTGTGALSSTSLNGLTTETLTFPVSATFAFASDTTTNIDLTLTGQIVAESTFATPPLGDYNENGVVDAADYVVWRKNLGSGTSLPNDDTAGVGADDYTRWQAQFGVMAGSGAGLGTAVPEGAAGAIALVALFTVGVARWRHWP